MASNRPLSSNVQPTSLTLTWSAGRVPSYVKNATITYIIEKREPPGHIWTVLARDVPTTRYDVQGLDAERDYMFRVRAKNDFGTSEPTLPMTLYRERGSCSSCINSAVLTLNTGTSGPNCSKLTLLLVNISLNMAHVLIFC